MRPKPWLSDLVKGEFWLPGRAEQKVPGVFVRRRGRLSLELIGSFGSEDDAYALPLETYPIVCGWLAAGGPITLLQCHSSKSLSAPGMLTEQVSFGKAVNATQIAIGEQLYCTAITAYVHNLDKWLATYGLAVSIFLPGNEGAVAWNATYSRPTPLGMMFITRPEGLFEPKPARAAH